MKTATKKEGIGRPARAKKNRADSEFALVKATAKVPAILDGVFEAPEVPTTTDVPAPTESPEATEVEVNGIGEAVASEASNADAGALPVEVEASSTPNSRVLESPLARRMREEAAQKKSSRKRGSKPRTDKRDLGPEFAAADAEVTALETQITTVTAEVRGAVAQEITNQITELRRQLRALKQRKKAALEAAGGERLRELRAALAEAITKRDQAEEAALSGAVSGTAVATPDVGEVPDARAARDRVESEPSEVEEMGEPSDEPLDEDNL